MLSWDELCHATFGCVELGFVRLGILGFDELCSVWLSFVGLCFAKVGTIGRS